MPDREKVIKALEMCETKKECVLCPYTDWCGDYDDFAIDCTAKLATDALALLKEQEAVEPEVEVLNEIDRLYRCPRCHKHFFYEKQKYCDQCGQAVKWE